MDLFYDILDEFSGNPPSNQQAIADNKNFENRHQDIGIEQYSTRSNTEEDKAKSIPFLDIDGEPTADSLSLQRQNSHQWESHTKNIQGEFSKASNPEQNFKVPKDFDLKSFSPKEGWLNLDDLELKTSPSEFSPPSRPAPVRDISSRPSTSGQNYTEGKKRISRAKGKEKEQFITKIMVKRRLDYELVGEDVYDDHIELEGRGKAKHQEQDLIHISTIDLDGHVTEDRIASELSEKAEKQMRKVSKVIEQDLSIFFDDTSNPTSSTTTTEDRKSKSYTRNDGRGMPSHQSTEVVEMKERDLKRQQEREDIEKVTDGLEIEFKRWSAGKEGNLRALLSSLQNILGSEVGWQPIPMTALLESASVRKQYKRATLVVHPDKLQQKGATPRQKYIAERIFALLKEASKKFNSEELL